MGIYNSNNAQEVQLVDSNGNPFNTFVLQKSYTQLYSITYSAITSTQDGIDINVSPYSELAVNINCSSISGTSPQLVIKVQRKDSFGIYYTIGNSSTISTSPILSFMSVGPGLAINGSLGGTIRIEANLSGTTPQASVTIDVGGK